MYVYIVYLGYRLGVPPDAPMEICTALDWKRQDTLHATWEHLKVEARRSKKKLLNTEYLTILALFQD